MTKDNSVDDRSKLYLTFHEADSLLLEKCKMKPKAGSFYRVQNKEQEEKNRKHLTRWGPESVLFAM